MPHQTIAFPGEARSYFKDWLVVCQKTPHSPDNPGICHSNVSVKDKKLFPYSDGTIFQLTLQRTVNSNHHIEFYHTLECRCPSSEVCLQVDNHPKTTFMVQAEGNLAKLSNEQSSSLIPLIQAGCWLIISYISQGGKLIEMKMSLRGSSASLLFIDKLHENRVQSILLPSREGIES